MKEQPFFVQGPAGKIEGLFAAQTDIKVPVIGIVCHPHPEHQGTMDNKVVTTICRAWQGMGLETIRFNFRGVGQSEGAYGGGVGEAEDLLAVVNWVRTQKPGIDIWLGGFSFGSYIAAKMANAVGAKALLTVGPPISRTEFKSISLEGLLPDCPWVIIHGEKDELFLIKDVQAWYQSLRTQNSEDSDPNSGQNSDQNPAESRPQSPTSLIIFKTLPETNHFFHGKLGDLKDIIVSTMQPFLT